MRVVKAAWEDRIDPPLDLPAPPRPFRPTSAPARPLDGKIAAPAAPTAPSPVFRPTRPFQVSAQEAHAMLNRAESPAPRGSTPRGRADGPALAVAVVERDAQIRDLASRVAELEAQLSRSSLQAEAASAGRLRELEDAEAKLAVAEVKLAAHDGRILDLEEMLADQDAVNTADRLALEACEAKLSAQEQRLREVEEVEEKLNVRDGRIHDLEEMLADQAEAAGEAVQEAKLALQEGRIHELEEMLADQDAQNTADLHELAVAEAKIAVQEGRIHELEEMLADQDEQNTTDLLELEACEAKLEQSEQLVLELAAKIDSAADVAYCEALEHALEEQVVAREQALRKRDTHIAERDVHIAQLEASLKGAADQHIARDARVYAETLSHRVCARELVSEVAALRAALAARDARLAALEAALEERAETVYTEPCSAASLPESTWGVAPRALAAGAAALAEADPAQDPGTQEQRAEDAQDAVDAAALHERGQATADGAEAARALQSLD